MNRILLLSSPLLLGVGLSGALGSDWSVGIRIGNPPGPRCLPYHHAPGWHHHHVPSWGFYYRPYPVYVRPAPVIIRPAPVIYEAAPTTVVVPTPAYSPPAPAPIPAAPAPFQPPAPREIGPAAGIRQTNGSLPNFEGLLASLRSTDENARMQAALDLGRSREERAVDPLAATLAGDRSAAVRDAAARGLGLLASPRGLTALVHAAQADPDRDVRRSAQFAVEVIQSRQGR